MVTPIPFVGDVHALFALARGHGQRAVHIHERFVEEFLRLPLPHLEPRAVDRVEQLPHLRANELAEHLAGLNQRGQRGQVGFQLAGQNIRDGSCQFSEHRQPGDIKRLVHRNPNLKGATQKERWLII